MDNLESFSIPSFKKVLEFALRKRIEENLPNTVMVKLLKNAQIKQKRVEIRLLLSVQHLLRTLENGNIKMEEP